MLVLLDRDGVLNHNLKRGVLSLNEFVMLPGAAKAVAALNEAGYRVAICTNQSAVGRGQLSEATLGEIHDTLQDAVNEAGGHIDAFYFAPDRPEAATDRRKPGAGMLREALADFGADAARTWFVGDALRDLQAAATAGCPRILVRTGHGAATEQAGLPDSVTPTIICDDLTAAVKHILSTGA